VELLTEAVRLAPQDEALKKALDAAKKDVATEPAPSVSP
jgi:hypothetical protein